MKEKAEDKWITAEKAHEILLEEGLQITLEEARLILDFLRKLAILTVKQYLKQHENSRFVYKGEYRRTGRQRLLTTRPGRKAEKILQ